MRHKRLAWLPMLLAAALLAGCGSDGSSGAAATATPTATPTPTPNPLAQACTDSGGSLTTALCCIGAGAFPDTCRIGSCGCSPSSSQQVPLCQCGAEACWDGSHCVGRTTPTPTADPGARACLAAGGSIGTYTCCADIGDFAATCGPPRSCELCGADGTAALRRCDCPSAGDCWDGSACVPAVAE